MAVPSPSGDTQSVSAPPPDADSAPPLRLVSAERRGERVLSAFSASGAWHFLLAPPNSADTQQPQRRSASDFHALRHRLRLFCPGVVLPPLPAEAFLADGSGWLGEACSAREDADAPSAPPDGPGGALRSLSLFCADVSRHPLLRECPDLALFSSADAGWPPAEAALAQAEASQPYGWEGALGWASRLSLSAEASTLSSLLDSFASAAAHVEQSSREARLGALALAEPAEPAAPLTGEEEALEEADAYLAHLAPALRSLASDCVSFSEKLGTVAAQLTGVQAAAAALSAAEAALCSTSDSTADRAEPGLAAALTAAGAAAAEAAPPLLDAARGIEERCCARLARAAALACAARDSISDRRAAALALRRGERGARPSFDSTAGRCAAELPRAHARLSGEAGGALSALLAAVGGRRGRRRRLGSGCCRARRRRRHLRGRRRAVCESEHSSELSAKMKSFSQAFKRLWRAASA